MKYYQHATATFTEVDGEMIHDGYYLYSDGGAKKLAWVSINSITEVK